MKQRRRRIILLIALGAALLSLLAALCATGINAWMTHAARPYILTRSQAVERGEYDCILVLGAGVTQSGVPSAMLRDRLGEGVALYQAAASPKLMMTGDHGSAEYDEVNVMKRWAVERGIPADDVFMDHAGFSTYESMYRARDVFGARRVLIVTQEYHLYRAIYIARSLGLEADGVASDPYVYSGQAMRDVREFAARVKDYFFCALQPKPTYLGPYIPISGSGSLTDD